MDANDGRVVSNFIVQALKGEPITVYGDGTQTRSFCYVDDLIEGFIRLFFTESIFQPINLGNPAPIRMIELAREILELTNSNSEIVMKSLPVDDPKQREPDITKAIKLLSWLPIIERKEGLKKTVEFFRTQGKNLDKG
jgi:nucleoside-diphosphate-sugar epimerase